MTSTKEKQARLRRNEEKWTEPLMKAGFTVIPSVILERQRGLALDAVDVNILLHLARHWWHRDNPPFPSKRVIAECMGIDVSTVRRRIARLERDGLIHRKARFSGNDGRQQTNSYHFDGLIKAATPFAEEAVAVREKRQAEDTQRRTRKRARPPIVDDESGDF